MESDGMQARFSRRKTFFLEVKKPGTNTVVLSFKIDFKVEANAIMHGVDFSRVCGYRLTSFSLSLFD